MIIIILFILILNVVSILLMYKSLTNNTPKEKLIFIAIGTSLMYILTSIVYWISTKNVAITEVSDLGKDLIIFLFVPINAIIVLPIFARSYCKYKDGGINGKVLRNRGIVLAVILLVLLIVECSYFENIQNAVVKMINNKTEQDSSSATLNSVLENDVNELNQEANVNELNQEANVNVLNQEANVQDSNNI